MNVKILEEDIDRYLKEELKAIVTSDKEADTQPTAVFPTPGSPTNKGLFFVLLHKT